MTRTIKDQLTKRWLLILKEYELVKSKNSQKFKTVQELCKTFEVTRRDIYRYYNRWIETGKSRDSLLPHRRGPKPGQLKILSKEDERIIIKIRRRLQSNEHEIQYLIKGHFEIEPSVSTIYRTFKRYPLNKKRKQAIKRYEKQYPGEMLHADLYHIDRTLCENRQQHYVFGMIDDCTRLCYVEILERATLKQTSQAFSRGYKWFTLHGIIPESLMTDNGVEFTSKRKSTHGFEVTLSLFNVDHIYIKPYRPQTNGKIERFWRILQDECLNIQEKTLPKNELTKELNAFAYRYNYQRRHGGLEYVTPLDKLKFVANLLPEC